MSDTIKIIDIQDKLASARSMVDLIRMAAEAIGRDMGDPISRACGDAHDRILEVNEMLEALRAEAQKEDAA